MDCRHTLPDWHRYVRPTGEALPIFAACRLLVKEGEPAADPRSIACAYWGRQPECPLYDGPGVQRRDLPRPGAWAASQEVPVEPEAVWPVRAPGMTDRLRIVLIGLGVLSTVLLGWLATMGLSVLSGRVQPAATVPLALVAASVSIVTHILTTLKMWARR
jgi:hypothetical protein